jgi:plasmid stabilization system protein ParE
VIVFEGQVFEDLEGSLEDAILIQDPILILKGHPEIGRTVAGSPLRELVISHGSSGYVALYEHSRVQNVVRVVAVRHQREAGYRD